MLKNDYDKQIPGKFEFDIHDVPFSRKLSFLYIGEDDRLPGEVEKVKHLYISRQVKKYRLSTEPDTPVYPGLISIIPCKKKKRIPYTLKAEPSILTLKTEDGWVQFCFDNKDLIRIRSNNIQLHFSALLTGHEAAISRLDGTYQVSFDPAGEFLLVPVTGKTEFESEWNAKAAACSKFDLYMEPEEDGVFEMCIHYAYSNTKRQQEYRPFESCMQEAREDYEAWYAMYPKVSAIYEYTKRIAAYSVWICYVAPMGLLKDYALLFQKNDCAFSWQSAYNAMAICNDAEMSVRLLLTAFGFQDEYGEIPDLFDDHYINILATKPPFHGAAVLYMLKSMGDKITAEQCSRMYEPLTGWCRWWLTFRDTDHDGVPQYNQGCESGADTTMMLSKGVPAECPDIISYVILLEEALGYLAERLGKAKEANEWFMASKKLTNSLIQDFWDGNHFIARVSTTHVPVETTGLEGYAPVLLGSRIPSEIMDKMANDLEAHYLTECGLSPVTLDEGNPAFVFVEGFDQLKFSIGLFDAGKTELARKIVKAYCDESARRLPSFGYTVGQLPEDPGIQGAFFFSGYGKCSSLSGCIFLTLSGLLTEMEEKG